MCPGGSPPPVDRWTGFLLYDACPQPETCEDEQYAVAYSDACKDPEPPIYDPSKGEAPDAAPWYAPDPEARAYKLGAVASEIDAVAKPKDRIDWDMANVDQGGDGIPDREDPCVDMVAAGSDSDGDGMGDACDLDDDGLENRVDACPQDATDSCCNHGGDLIENRGQQVVATVAAGGSTERQVQ